MKKIFELIGFIFFLFFIFFLSIFFIGIKPKWNFYLIDEKNGETFVSVTIAKGLPNLFYYDRNFGGIYHLFPKSEDKILEAFKYWKEQKREFLKEKIEKRNLGYFLSSYADEKGNIHLAYQDPTLGRERVIHAFLDKEWKFEVVDDVRSGINVGVETKIILKDSKPFIFYHIEQGKKFMVAEKNGKWKKVKISENNGWITSLALCNNKIYIVHRQRNSSQLYLTYFENSWITKKIDAFSDLSFDLDCYNSKLYLAYSSKKDGMIKIFDIFENEKYDVAKGYFSKVQLAIANQKFYVFYNFFNSNMKVAISEDLKNWEIKDFDKERFSGETISVATNGKDIYVLYTTRKKVKFAEFFVSYISLIKNLFLSFSILSFSLSLAFFIISRYKK